MLNYIWSGLLIFGFIIGAVNGRMQEVTRAVVDSSGKAIELSIALLGIMCLWTGLMAIANKSGVVDTIAKLLRPLLKILFPGIPLKHPAASAILMNMTANFFGLGNAATPLGIKAMQELQKLNHKKTNATNEMCMFLVLNTAGLQLIPTTVIAIRTNAGSANGAEIVGAVWITSICATIAGIVFVKIFSSYKYLHSVVKIKNNERSR